MDLAHKITDKELEKLEKRIAAEYKKAADEMQVKVDAYFQSFAKRDAEQKKLIGTTVNGKEYTERDYKQWRIAQIGRGKRMEDLRDKLAERMTRANEVTAAYINGDMAKIYAMNRAYIIQDIRQQADGVLDNVDFALWDERTVKMLLVEQPDLLPYYPEAKAVERGIDLAYGKKQINKYVTQGILQGESINQMARKLMDNVEKMERENAVRAARTYVTAAENAGRQAGREECESKGVILNKRWQSAHDSRTRHAHMEADGQIVLNDMPFEVGGEYLMFPGDTSHGASGWNIYNCFIGETKVASDSDVVRSYKHKYQGKLATVKSAAGVEFTCTLNHPILTPCGWVPAKLLQNGDDLLVTFGGKVSMLGVNPDIEHTFPRIDAVHDFLNMNGVKRTFRMMVNFHGDIPTSDVEIVAKKRFLRANRDTGGGNCFNKFLLVLSNFLAFSFRHFMKCFFTICESALCLVCRKCKPLSFLWRGLSHSDIHRFRTATGSNVILHEYTIDNTPAETILSSEFFGGLSRKVFLDKVVSVEVSSKSSHVYNLQTKNGYYFVNSIISQEKNKCNGIFAIAKNCRCTSTAEIVGFRPMLTASQRNKANIRVD